MKINLQSFADEDDEENRAIYGEGWKRLGYHRPIGSFLYSIWLLIPSLIIGLLFLPLLKYTKYRFPEISSFEAAAGGLFGALYLLLDFDLKAMVDRFVPEKIISNPRSASYYISFFIRYQMYSGLIQVTFVSLFLFLYVIPYTNFAYLSWFILFIVVKQYPGMLGTFSSLLDSLQQGKKFRKLLFYRASILEPITTLGMGLIGLYWGGNNPEVGEMMGLALGWAIGAYLDDFFAFVLGAFYLSKVLDAYSIRIIDIFGQKVPREIIRSGINYSSRFWPKTIYSAAVGFTSFMVTYNNLPGYLTYQGLIGEANKLKKFVGWSDDILNSSQPAFSEAFNNQKYELTKYYIAQGLRYNSLFFMILGGLNLFLIRLLVDILISVGILKESWSLIGDIVPILVILWMYTPFDDVTKKMINISAHPEFNTFLEIFTGLISLGITYYFLAVLELGWIGLVLAPVPMALFNFIARWTYMTRKVLNMKGFWRDVGWQIFIAPAIAGFAFIMFLQGCIRWFWPILSAPHSGINLLIAGIGLIVFLIFVGTNFIYVPIIAFMGFWDKQSLRDFGLGVSLSGPSMYLLYPWWLSFKYFYKKSPFKRFEIKLGLKANQELLELSILRNQRISEFLEK